MTWPSKPSWGKSCTKRTFTELFFPNCLARGVFLSKFLPKLIIFSLFFVRFFCEISLKFAMGIYQPWIKLKIETELLPSWWISTDISHRFTSTIFEKNRNLEAKRSNKCKTKCTITSTWLQILETSRSAEERAPEKSASSPEVGTILLKKVSKPKM